MKTGDIYEALETACGRTAVGKVQGICGFASPAVVHLLRGCLACIYPFHILIGIVKMFFCGSSAVHLLQCKVV